MKPKARLGFESREKREKWKMMLIVLYVFDDAPCGSPIVALVICEYSEGCVSRSRMNSVCSNNVILSPILQCAMNDPKHSRCLLSHRTGR